MIEVNVICPSRVEVLRASVMRDCGFHPDDGIVAVEIASAALLGLR